MGGEDLARGGWARSVEGPISITVPMPLRGDVQLLQL